MKPKLSYPTRYESFVSIGEAEKSVVGTLMEFTHPNCASLIITFVSAAVSVLVVGFLT